MECGYDIGDVLYLVERFSLMELRRERHNTERDMAVEMAFGDQKEANISRALVACFDEAIALVVSARPKPKPIAGHIDVATVKAHMDIVAVAEKYTTLKKSGKNYQGLCPVHADKKSPSFTVYPEDQTFHCFGCQAHGDVIALVMACEHLDFKAACAVLGG